MWGLILLGFTSVYREGFEVVLFLQNLRLSYGAGIVLEGVALGLALTALVGGVTFFAHRQLPYKRMLVLTGVMLGVVLIVMVGESIQEMQLAGWLPETTVALSIPGWVGPLVRGLPDGRGPGRPGARRGARARVLLRGRVLAGEAAAPPGPGESGRRPRRGLEPGRAGLRPGPEYERAADRPGTAASAVHQRRDDRFVEAVPVGLLGDRDVAELG